VSFTLVNDATGVVVLDFDGSAGGNSVTYTALPDGTNAILNFPAPVADADDWTLGGRLSNIIKMVRDRTLTCLLKRDPSNSSTTLYFTNNIKEYGAYTEILSSVSGIAAPPSAIAITDGRVAVGTTDGKIYEIAVDHSSASPQSYTEIYSGNDSIVSLNVISGQNVWTFGTEGGIVATLPFGGGGADIRVDLAVIVAPGSHTIDVESVQGEGHIILIRNGDFTFQMLIITSDWSQIKSGGEISAALRNINPLEISYNPRIGMWVAAGGNGETLNTDNLANWIV